MKLATCPNSPAPDRCDARARRLVQVKFVALPLDFEAERPAAETVSSLPARIYRSVRDLLSRVMGRLVAARPQV